MNVKRNTKSKLSNKYPTFTLKETKLQSDSDSIKRRDQQTDIQMCKEG